MLFKSTGSDYPSLWEHFCFILQGKHHIHKAHNTPLSFSEFTLPPASLRRQKHRLPPQSQLCLLSCTVSTLTPPPCADWLPGLSAHEVMGSARAPFLLHINSSPSLYQVMPTSLQNHVVTSSTFKETHTHIHSYSHMHPWFPLYFCSPLWQNSPQTVYICCPPFSARS